MTPLAEGAKNNKNNNKKKNVGLKVAVSSAAVPPPSPSSPTTSSSGNDRLANTTACLPIVYGSVAFFLGKKADEYHTHKWTLYLRSPNQTKDNKNDKNQEDLSLCVAKVVFQLHTSFAQPVRELVEPPFEVTERGWGEFEAQIRIVWKDPAEKPTIVSSRVLLFAPCFFLCANES